MRGIFKAGLIFILFIALSAVGLGALTAPNAILAYRGVAKARDAIESAEAAVLRAEAMDITAAVRHLEVASAQLRFADRAMRRLDYLQLIPWVSGQFKTARAAIKGVADSADALAVIGRAFSPIREAFRAYGDIEFGAISREKREELLGGIYDSLPALQAARTNIERAAQRMAGSVPLWHPELEAERLQIVRALAAVAGVLQDGVPLLENMLPVVGFPEPANYLIILQNSDEMRPTGGFIGTYGLIAFDAGHITKFFTDDVYNLDRFAPGYSRPTAPSPIAKYLEQPRWFLRDANWSPDFPTSAKQIMRFHKEEMQYIPEDRKQKTEDRYPSSVFRPPSSEFDGVIAVMPEAIRPLLKLTGPLEVKGQTFTAENLTDALEYEVEIGFEQKGIPRPQRKEIISELGHALIARILELPVEKWPDVARTVRSALDEKHLLVFARETALQEQIMAQGWAGSIIAAEGQDYFAVFDANMFSLKTDPYVVRSIFYNARVSPNGPVGDLEIVYSYPSSGPAWKTKGYRSWVRVYVPKGAVLISATGAMVEEDITRPGEVEISQESDKTVFGAFLAVQAGDTKRLRFSYRLPEEIATRIADGTYMLYVQKQPGTVGHSLTVAADFGKVPRIWEPRGLSASRDETKLTWQGSLRRDQEFEVEF